MKNTNKRLLSLLLTVLLLLGTVAGVLSAAAEGEQNSAVGNLTQFGNYPQTLVEETDALQAAAEAAVWTSYGYYSGKDSMPDSMTQGDFMQFADFFCEGEKYRAVKFSDYRPHNTYSEYNSIQSVNGYSTNQIYYFKYEPLLWRCYLSAGCYLICENIIDAQPFQNVLYTKDGIHFMQDEDCQVFPNHYETSTILDWLNYDFYETAFSPEQKERLYNARATNDVLSGFNSSGEALYDYGTGVTREDVYVSLLSFHDASMVSKSFPPRSANGKDTELTAKGTDYAKCQGLYVGSDSNPLFDGNSWWWLSTALNPTGTVGGKDTCDISPEGIQTHFEVTGIQGIRPAIVIIGEEGDSTMSETLFSEMSHQHMAGTPTTENKTAATCTKAGSYDEVITCTGCREEISRTPVTVDPLNHKNAQNIAATDSTCKEHGFAAGIYCPDCDTWISGHEALPLAEHSFGGWVVTQQPTTDRTGTETRTCSVCGETETRSIDKLPQPDNSGNDNNSDDDDGGFFGWIQRAMKGLVDWFKKLLSFLRK